MLEILPIIIFFIVFKTSSSIAMATLSTIIATATQMLLSKFIFKKKISDFELISLSLITVFGGATICFNNTWFIKLKPSVVYWLFATLLSINKQKALKTNKPVLLEQLAKKSVKLTTKSWYKLTNYWCYYFVILGLVNLIIAYNFDTNFWVHYKVFGTIAFTIIFVIIQYLCIYKKEESGIPQ